MCGRFTFRQRLEDIMRAFNVSAPQDWQYSLRYNIAPTNSVLWFDRSERTAN